MDEYRASVDTLKLVIGNGRSLDSSFSAQNSPLSKQICYGVLRNYYQLSALLDRLLSRPLAKKHADVQLLLLAGIYSIDHLKRPVHATVNATVESVVGMKKPWAKSLVNGVLRNYLRKRDDLSKQLSSNPEATSNHPGWLLQRLQTAYGDRLAQIVEANNLKAPMTLRVNLARTSRADYQADLSACNIESSPGRLTPSALYLHEPQQISDLPGFDEGLISIQDEASQLAASLLNLQPAMQILDACCAPGGKTCHILEHTRHISLTALDRDSARLSRVRENLDRLGLDCDLRCEDLLHYQTGRRFDRILLDAPCSATGIIRRHPDIKLLRRDTDIDKLATTQLELLAKAFSLLKESGELVYSTCSILPTENEHIIRAFKNQNTQVQILPVDVECGLEGDCGRQLLPSKDGVDGFFYARIKKRMMQ